VRADHVLIDLRVTCGAVPLLDNIQPVIDLTAQVLAGDPKYAKGHARLTISANDAEITLAYGGAFAIFEAYASILVGDARAFDPQKDSRQW
jgi:hypothetical protein